MADPFRHGQQSLDFPGACFRPLPSSKHVSEQVIQTSSIMFSAIYRGLWRSFGRIDSNYELELQIAQMRKQPEYVPEDIPPPTSFGIKCQPKADQVCAELDEYFFKNWPWEDKAAGQKFLRSETNPIAVGLWQFNRQPKSNTLTAHKTTNICSSLLPFYCGPKNTTRVLTTQIFSIADVAETLSISEGKALYERLVPIALGKTQPDRNDPYEWMTYDIWKSMRATDPELTEVVWQGALLCITAQVDDARTKCPDLGSLLKHRAKEAGIAFVAAVLRFSQALHLTPTDIASITPIHTSYALLGVTVNDILSFDKELRAQALLPTAEGAYILNMTKALANDTELDYRASKRVLWVLCREWEVRHRRLVEERMARGGVSRDLEAYLTGLEFVLGGNEWWSWRTERYQERKG
ncbi:MAG: hypothetical protein Q9176_004992 [Flavoplaca citrina]